MAISCYILIFKPQGRKFYELTI